MVAYVVGPTRATWKPEMALQAKRRPEPPREGQRRSREGRLRFGAPRR